MSSVSSSRLSSRSEDVEVSGRGRGIRAIDIAAVFSSPKEAELLANITAFDLSRNELTNLSNLGPLRSLLRLDASYNQLTRMGGLPLLLTQLNLSHNKLQHLEGIQQLTHLKELDVSFNRLTSLRDLTPRLPLEVLRVEDNRLQHSCGLEGLASLRILSLANNFMESADELLFLSSTPALQIVNLQGNPLTHVRRYRQMVALLQPSIASLDGAPLPPPPPPLQSSIMEDSTVVEQRRGAAAAPRPSSSPSAYTAPPLPSAKVAAADRGNDLNHTRTAPIPPHRRPPTTPTLASSTTHSELQQSGPDFATNDMAAVVRQSSYTTPEPSTTTTTTTTTMSTAHANGSAGAEEADADVMKQKQQQQMQRSTAEAQLVDSPFKIIPLQQKGEAVQVESPSSLSHSHQSRYASVGVQTPRAGRNAIAAHGSYRAMSAATSPSFLQRSTVSQESDYTSARLHDSLVAKEQAEKESRALRQQIKKAETQLSEARRVISAQLAELSKIRLERDALRQSESDTLVRLDRERRAVKIKEEHHSEEVATLQLQYTRMKTFYESQLADTRRELAAEQSRSRRSAASAPKETEDHCATAAVAQPSVSKRSSSLPSPQLKMTTAAASASPTVVSTGATAAVAASDRHQQESDVEIPPVHPSSLSVDAVAIQLQSWLGTSSTAEKTFLSGEATSELQEDEKRTRTAEVPHYLLQMLLRQQLGDLSDAGQSEGEESKSPKTAEAMEMESDISPVSKPDAGSDPTHDKRVAVARVMLQNVKGLFGEDESSASCHGVE